MANMLLRTCREILDKHLVVENPLKTALWILVYYWVDQMVNVEFRV